MQLAWRWFVEMFFLLSSLIISIIIKIFFLLFFTVILIYLVRASLFFIGCPTGDAVITPGFKLAAKYSKSSIFFLFFYFILFYFIFFLNFL